MAWLKALCEQGAEEAMPGRVLIIRPGLIVGPHDYTTGLLTGLCA
jgi:2'-hydroxyisoflavone reductase